jgi:hypothetical protein
MQQERCFRKSVTAAEACGLATRGCVMRPFKPFTLPNAPTDVRKRIRFYEYITPGVGRKLQEYDVQKCKSMSS